MEVLQSLTVPPHDSKHHWVPMRLHHDPRDSLAHFAGCLTWIKSLFPWPTYDLLDGNQRSSTKALQEK